MKEKLTKQQAASIATRLLINIYVEDIKAAATIIAADAIIREGDESGYMTLTDALASARDFIQELINAMIYEQERTEGLQPTNQRHCQQADD